MIDMSALYDHVDYPAALSVFTDRKRWSVFQDVQLKVAKQRCPICECCLDGTVTRPSFKGIMVIVPTIDHYRPKDQTLYPFLKYSHSNYILMCSDCNNAYKGNQFPLYGTAPRATTVAGLAAEQPLIVNPIHDDLLPLFTVVLQFTSSGRKVLALKPRENSGYLQQKAQETIKVFCLGDCDVNVHKSMNVHNGRIELLHDHFKKFEGFITALADKNKEQALHEYNKYDLGSYGFTKFISQGLFVDLTVAS